jgi:CheY-like chemotaxis protein
MRDIPALIAIIDDDASVCRSLQRLIRSFGMRTAAFASGELFLLFLASAERPDCALLDVQMPGVNGLEVQEQPVRDRFDLPLIFISDLRLVSDCSKMSVYSQSDRDHCVSISRPGWRGVVPGRRCGQLRACPAPSGQQEL